VAPAVLVGLPRTGNVPAGPARRERSGKATRDWQSWPRCSALLAAARLDDRDAFAIRATRADRNEAIAVTGALLYWLPAGDAAWPEVALALGRLSYDRYTDP